MADYAVIKYLPQCFQAYTPYELLQHPVGKDCMALLHLLPEQKIGIGHYSCTLAALTMSSKIQV
jgi:hypothetical protein